MWNESEARAPVTDDWFWDWVDRHMARFPRGDWPPLEAEYWKAMRHMLVTKGVTEAVAEAASMLMFGEPSIFPDEHPETLLAKVRQVWRESEVATIPISPAQGRVPDFDFDRAARAHWDSLPEADREEARQMVRERLPVLARRSRWLDGLACGWAYDPALAAGSPPPPDPHSPRDGPRRIFSGEANPIP